MALIRKTIKLGNSAGVLLPKNLLGCEVKINVVKRPFDIKREVLRALYKHLEDLQGIYITNNEPLEILAISTTTKAIISSSKMKISLVPLQIIEKDIKLKKPITQKIMKAETIFNKDLISKLKKEIKS